MMFSEGVRRRLDQPNANWINSMLCGYVCMKKRKTGNWGVGEVLSDARYMLVYVLYAMITG